MPGYVAAMQIMTLHLLVLLSVQGQGHTTQVMSRLLNSVSGNDRMGVYSWRVIKFVMISVSFPNGGWRRGAALKQPCL